MKDKKKDEAIFQIVDSVEIVATIICSKCSAKEQTAGISDDFQAADEFYESGWRATDYEVLCKACRTKKKK